MQSKKIWVMLPFLLSFVLGAILWQGLSQKVIAASPLINKKVPNFQANSLFQETTVSQADLQGQPSLVIFWASWCSICAQESSFLMHLKQQGIRIIGINYHDDPQDAKAFLKSYGNPYEKIGQDPKGKIALQWGVYGTPEIFLVDANGMIRYKIIGELNESNWNRELKPQWQKWQN